MRKGFVRAARRYLGAVALLVIAAHTARAADVATVNVGHTNSAADIGVFIAQDRGYFAKQGIQANFIAFESGSQMIAPFATGGLDVGGGAPSAALYNAVGRGVGIRIVADKNSTPLGYPSLTIVVRKDLVTSGRYKTLKDLKGMKMGTTVYGTAGDGTIAKLFQNTGLTKDDINMIRLGYPAQLAALENKGIDAAMPSEPLTTQILKSGLAIKAASDDEIYPGHQNSTLIYSEKFASNKDLAKRFMIAYIQGVRDFNDGLVGPHLIGAKGEAIITILTKHTPIKDPEVFRQMDVNFCDPNGKLNVESMKSDLDVLRNEGLIQKPVQVEQALDLSFQQAALAALGPYKKAQ